MFKKISILLLFLFFVKNLIFAYSADILDRMEYIKYGTAFNQEPLSSRLTRLETDCFGMSQSGDLDSRIEKLSKIIAAGNYGNILTDNYYDYPKKNFFQKVWDGFSSYMTAPYITGFSPSIINYNDDNNPYEKEYMMQNNSYCPFNNIYKRNNRLYNYNKYGNNQNGLNSYNPYIYRKPYYRNSAYSSPFPGDLYTNVLTGSTVHILRD